MIRFLFNALDYPIKLNFTTPSECQQIMLLLLYEKLNPDYCHIIFSKIKNYTNRFTV